MSDARVEMLTESAAVEAAGMIGVNESIAKLNVFRTLLRRPKTAKAVSDLLFSLLFGAELSDRRRELVIMRIGWITGCDYEWTQHWPIAQDVYGCTPEELLAVREPAASDLFDEGDRAILQATDELVQTGEVTEPTWRRCHDALGDEAAIDLIASIGCWGMISKLARGLHIPLEDGVASWPPDGLASLEE